MLAFPFINPMETRITSPQIRCSCGKIIYEMDGMNCHCCGDIMCESCFVDCFDCGKMYCKNCSTSYTQCIKCSVSSKLKISEDKAYISIGNGEKYPIKNSHFMISLTSQTNARGTILKFNGKEYKYLYRSLHCREGEKGMYDYFLHFEECISDKELEKRIKDSLKALGDDYDDYGIL